MGPDLTRVGVFTLDRLFDRNRSAEPDKELSEGMQDPNNHYGLPLVYDTVTVDLKNKEKVTGVAKNEDTFWVEVLDTNQRLRLFLKSEVLDVVHERKDDASVYRAHAQRCGTARLARVPE